MKRTLKINGVTFTRHVGGPKLAGRIEETAIAEVEAKMRELELLTATHERFLAEAEIKRKEIIQGLGKLGKLIGYSTEVKSRFERNAGVNFCDVFLGLVEIDPRFRAGEANPRPNPDRIEKMIARRFGKNFVSEAALRMIAASKHLRTFKFIVENAAHGNDRDFFIRLGKALSGKKRKRALPFLDTIDWEIMAHFDSSNALGLPLKAFTDKAAHDAVKWLLRNQVSISDDYGMYKKRRQRLDLRPDASAQVREVKVERNGSLQLVGKGGQILGNSRPRLKRH